MVEGRGKPLSAITGRLSEIEGLVTQTEGRVGKIETEVEGLRGEVNAVDVAARLVEFEGLWGVLHYAEQAQLVQSLVESVRCDGDGNAEIAFRRHEPLQGGCG